MSLSPDELPDHGDELLSGEGLAQVLVGALALAPHAIALLVLGAHQHHRHGLRAPVALEAAEDLVSVALRHHDVEEQQIRALLHHPLLELFAARQADDIEPGRLENAFHKLELRLGVIHDHDLGHRVDCPPVDTWVCRDLRSRARELSRRPSTVRVSATQPIVTSTFSEWRVGRESVKKSGRSSCGTLGAMLAWCPHTSWTCRSNILVPGQAFTAHIRPRSVPNPRRQFTRLMIGLTAAGILSQVER